MRARNIKPSIYKNEMLAIADPLYTVIFTGLWCAADREGRLEDRPAKWHMEINPGRGFESTERSLAWLTENEFIHRYSIDGKAYIQVVMFWKHQNPHYKEPPSTIPPEPKTQGNGVNHQTETQGSTVMDEDETGDASDENPGLAPGSRPIGEGQTRLIPDSGFLIPDSGSLIPDSHPPDGTERANAAPPAKRGTRIPQDFDLTPERRAYAHEHGVNPDHTFAMFTTYWRSKSGAGATKLDWDATWQHWCLKDQQKREPRKTRFEEVSSTNPAAHEDQGFG